MEKLVNSIFEEITETNSRFFARSKNTIISISLEIAKTFINGGKILLLGNGGSAADSQHIAAEFINRFKMERPPLPALALTTDTSVITSISNDYDFKDIFVKQLVAIANEGDVVWALSTSGNSPNVIRALQYAAKNNLKSVGFTGNKGDKMLGLCDILLAAPTDNTPRIQELHITSAHIICELVDELMFGKFTDNL
mgnify:CR=1 FL=1